MKMKKEEEEEKERERRKKTSRVPEISKNKPMPVAHTRLFGFVALEQHFYLRLILAPVCFIAVFFHRSTTTYTPYH